MNDDLFDNRDSLKPDEPPIRIPRSAPPFPVGQTAERKRELIRDGYTVVGGKTGVTVFDFGGRQ